LNDKNLDKALAIPIAIPLENGSKKLVVGLIINPVAGVGGPAGMKGSDGTEIYQLARDLGYKSKVSDRVMRALSILMPYLKDFRLETASGKMGGDLCLEISKDHSKLEFNVCYDTGISGFETRDSDTFEAVKRLESLGVDIILFAGGDGTARNIYDALAGGSKQLVLGIPCGVKMQSGVFAITPEAAGVVLQRLVEGRLVSAISREVRDIDEVALRSGKVNSRYYGEMWVPEQHQYIQATKQGGLEVEALVLEEIAAYIVEQIESDKTYIVGAGTTTASIMEKLGIPNTLLGVDVICGRQLVLADAREDELFNYLVGKAAEDQGEKNPIKLLVTPIGGQGHLFGRGNQQLSPRVISLIGFKNFIVVATKSKLESLGQLDFSLRQDEVQIDPGLAEMKGIRLLVDTGDIDLDRSLCGLIPVITGYEDAVVCRLALN